MHGLVTTDEFIAHCQSRHLSPFLQPEDRTKGSGEKDPFDYTKGNQACVKGLLAIDIPLGPLGFSFDGWESLNRIEQQLLLFFIRYVRVN